MILYMEWSTIGNAGIDVSDTAVLKDFPKAQNAVRKRCICVLE